MGIKVTGLDDLQKQLKEVETAMRSLNGRLAELTFDPSDRASVEGAIREMERAVDAKVSRYRGNALVMSIAERSKEAFRKAIREKARVQRA